jgi:group I intron endonuclease
MAYYVYLFSFPNGKYYVGRTNNFEDRLIGHKSKAKKRKKSILYFAINKYGWDNIDKKVIDEVKTLQQSIIKEYERIVEYNSVLNGYNSTYNTKDGGNVWIDREDTQEFKDFIEYMQKISVGEKNSMFGKNHSQESIVKQKEKAKGRFSLPWFIERYGEIEGQKKYEDRKLFLKSRNLKRSIDGKFQKS